MKLRVAAAQYEPHVNDNPGNREQAVAWAVRAAAGGAKLIVLPELASSGYMFADESEAAGAAESLSDSAFIAALTDVAAAHRCHIVSGFSERAETCRYNSAVVVGADGVELTYRKLHLFYKEQEWFAPGDALPVIDLPWGRLGVLICFDIWFPEAARALALAGADVIAVPTNWVSNFKSTVYDDRGYCQGDYVAMATAAQNGVVMVCADRIGTERDARFLGASIIVGADGWPLAGPAPADAESLLVADVETESIAAARARTPRNHLLNDRRADIYNVGTTPPAASTSSHN